MIKLSAVDFAQWRQQARALLAAAVDPTQVVWESQQNDLLGSSHVPDATVRRALRVPAQFLALAETVSLHRSPSRWQYLYRMVFRLVFENRRLLEDSSDPDSLQLRTMAKAIGHDVHKMQAFVRFLAAPTHTVDAARHRSRGIRALQDQLREQSEVLEPMAQARPGSGLDFIIDVERHGSHCGGECP